ncbi:MAG TPA: S4 domain-containing protein [Blastocatellia bacterium]|nr:S4 domain-containing protein [Blastocatellia bacterium]
MRLDVFLKHSRLVPRRSVAQELCESGAVRVNGQRAKSSREVRQGDELIVRTRHRVVTVRVVQVPVKAPSKAQAPSLYDLVKEEKILSSEF